MQTPTGGKAGNLLSPATQKFSSSICSSAVAEWVRCPKKAKDDELHQGMHQCQVNLSQVFPQQRKRSQELPENPSCGGQRPSLPA